jgi:UDP-galactose transporter B1
MSANPEIMSKIIKFSACSAVGQSFIFYTISNFDPLVCTTVTTTRKVFSVLLSIFLKGHVLSAQGWGGIALAVAGIMSEMAEKMGKSKAASKKMDSETAERSRGRWEQVLLVMEQGGEGSREGKRA